MTMEAASTQAASTQAASTQAASTQAASTQAASTEQASSEGTSTERADAPPPFGTVPAPMMAAVEARDGEFGELRVGPVEELRLHPFAHVLHYGSAGFEGLKAHRGTDGVVRLFRHEANVARMRRTAELLHLPRPSAALLDEAIRAAVAANLDVAPSAPGALYVRPLLFGTEPNIGAAAAPSKDAQLLVLCSPVGDYFAGGGRPLKLQVETDLPRTTPQFGEAKAGANYVMALGPTLAAKAAAGVDQVLFAPDGYVQETGAANFLLIDDDRVVTRALDSSFLHGITRDSVLTIARDLGYRVEERDLPVDELLAWEGEAALSGTAAVLASVGGLVHEGRTIAINGGEAGPNTRRLREALQAIQRGEAEDVHGWTTPIT